MVHQVEDSWRVENAGRDLARTAIFALGETLDSARVVVLTGDGPTGAAGVCAARYLAEEGVAVKLCHASPQVADHVSTARDAFLCAGGLEVAPERLAEEQPDLIVHALGGLAPVVRWARTGSASAIELELPSAPPKSREVDAPYTHPPLWTIRLALRGNGLSLGSAGELFL